MVLQAETQVATRVETAPAAAGARVAAWQIAVLVAYAALMVFALAHHERWFDESQAWLLGRDASIKDLLVRYPRYEGSPPLWQLLLAVPAKLGLPYWTLSALSGAIAFIGAALVVLRAPFPPVVRALVPFTYWVFFQYGVVARSYVLLGPALWLLAILWPRRAAHPWRFGLLLALLSVVSFHGYLVAASLLAVHSLRRRQPWLLAAAAAWSALLFLELKTPVDISRHASFHGDGRGALLVARAMFTGAFSNRLVILVAVAVTLVWLAARRAFLLWCVPTVAVLAFSAIRYGNVWHQGVLVEIWLFALWVSCDAVATEDAGRWTVPSWALPAMFVAMAGVMSVQLVWTAKTVRYDATHRYSAAAATAAYVKTLGAPAIDMRTPSQEATALQPYFRANLFRNVNGGRCPCFWWWSKHMAFDRRVADLPVGQPAAIVFGDKVAGHPRPRSVPVIAGYHVARYFSGGLYIRNQMFETEGFWVFVPDGP